MSNNSFQSVSGWLRVMKHLEEVGTVDKSSSYWCNSFWNDTDLCKISVTWFSVVSLCVFANLLWSPDFKLLGIMPSMRPHTKVANPPMKFSVPLKFHFHFWHVYSNQMVLIVHPQATFPTCSFDLGASAFPISKKVANF